MARLPLISLWAPWAGLLVAGVKTHETRSWAPPARLIGERWVIHETRSSPAPPEEVAAIARRSGVEPLPGRALATARLVRARPTADQRPADADDEALGFWSPGRFAWLFEDFELIDPPATVRGAQRMRYVDAWIL